MNRAVVFIDNGYFNKVIRQQFKGSTVDYELFSNNICGNCERLRTYVYDCKPYQGNPPTGDEKHRVSQMDKFVTAIKRLPRFEMRFGDLQKIWVDNKFTFKQKMADVLLSVDLVRLSWSKQMQDAVLVAGDHDFLPAVKAAKDAGVVVKLYYTNPIHDELLDACDETIMIDKNLINKSLLKPKQKK